MKLHKAFIRRADDADVGRADICESLTFDVCLRLGSLETVRQVL